MRVEGPRGKYKVAKGADLRILDDNIWDYSKDTIPVHVPVDFWFCHCSLWLVCKGSRSI